MLNALKKFAERDPRLKGIEPGFSGKDAKWAVVCSEDGRFAGIVPLGNPDDKKSKGRRFEKAPDLSQGELIAGGVTKSHFLIDSAKTVALLGVDPNDTSGAATKARAKHEYFVHLLQQASEAMPQLQAAARVLGDEATLAEVRRQMTDKKVKPTDKVTIQLGVGGPFPVESDAWHGWWRDYRKCLGGQPEEEEPQSEQAELPGVVGPARGKKPETGQMLDFITGKLSVPAKTHPKIRGLADVGGLPTGDALVGFDKDSFRSYGLDQSLNAAMSEENAKAYTDTLNLLIREQGHRLAGVKIIHWYDKPVPKDPVAAVDDPLAFLGEVSDEEKELHANEAVRKTLDAIRTGAKDDVNLRDNRYYALTASGAAGRVMVRDWMEGQFEDLVESITAWFDDLSIVRRDGDGIAAPPKFMAVLGATVRELRDLAPPFVAKMWRVAMRNEPIPREALAAALERFEVAVIEDNPINHAGVGLMKAYHVRLNRGGQLMIASVNPDHPEAAYHCGRLMAVLAQLQRAALGDVGAGVVQRYYPAASSTPALVVGRLVRTAQFHLDKLEGGLAHWYEDRIAEIMGKIGDRVPGTLTLEKQSLFALGYYQQLAEMRTKKASTAEEGKNNG